MLISCWCHILVPILPLQSRGLPLVLHTALPTMKKDLWSQSLQVASYAISVMQSIFLHLTHFTSLTKCFKAIFYMSYTHINMFFWNTYMSKRNHQDNYFVDCSFIWSDLEWLGTCKTECIACITLFLHLWKRIQGRCIDLQRSGWLYVMKDHF